MVAVYNAYKTTDAYYSSIQKNTQFELLEPIIIIRVPGPRRRLRYVGNGGRTWGGECTKSRITPTRGPNGRKLL